MAGPMLAWLAGNEPATYAATRWALQPKDWLRAQLTGRFATEPSDASATLLYDVAGDTWDADVIDALGLDRGEAASDPAALRRAGRNAAPPSAASLLGLRTGIPVAAGAADTAAAALGSGLTEPGTVQLTIGTGAQIVKPVAALPDPLPGRDPVTHLYRAATDTGWYAMGAVLNGGLTLGWVCRTLGAGWPELYAAAATAPRDGRPVLPAAPQRGTHPLPGSGTARRLDRPRPAPRPRRNCSAPPWKVSPSPSATPSTTSSSRASRSPTCAWPAAAPPTPPGGRCSPTSSATPSPRSRSRPRPDSAPPCWAPAPPASRTRSPEPRRPAPQPP